MKRIGFLLILLTTCIATRGFGCNLSDLSLSNVTYDSNNSQWIITTVLHVGSGVTGTTKGADADTRSIAFGFYKACTPFSLNSFLPATLNAIFTNCNMPGNNLGPQPAPYNTQGTLLYLDPGYYGIPPCVSTPFACITSTALCGNVASATYNLTFRTSTIPDSIRVFGVEGQGNALGGCYPNADMKISFGAGPNIYCPGPQQIPAGPSCLGIVPNFTTLAGISYNCTAMPTATVTQSPATGSIVGGVGSTTTITLTATFPNLQTASCSFAATVVDITPPSITCPANTTLSLNNACQATLPSYLTLATVSDNCTASPTRTQSPVAGTVITGSGVNTVTITATDASSNSSTCSFTVTTTDQTPPTINCPPNATVAADANCAVILQNYITLATVADNCAPAPTTTQNPLAGTPFSGMGTTTVMLLTTDASGNSSSCAFTVTRVDQTPPTVNCPPTDTVVLGSNCSTVLSNYVTLATAADNCSNNPIITQSPAAGMAINGPGTYTVTLTATDGSGNSSNCNLSVVAVVPSILGTTTQSPGNPCVGDVVTLTATTGLSYQWNTTVTTQSVQVTTTGWYWVDVTLATGCTARDSIFVSFQVLPQPVVTQVGNTVCTGTFSTYQWYLNGNLIPGATGPCTPINASGNYSVSVTDANGCIGTDELQGLVGNDPGAGNVNIVVYPVPASDILYVEVMGIGQAATEITLHDMLGKSLCQWQFEQQGGPMACPLQAVPSGTYLLSVRSETAGLHGIKKLLVLH